MRVLHYASRAVAAVALLVLAGACGDSTAPDAPFDPAGTNADVAAIGESFESPALESYAAAAPYIGFAVGGALSPAVQAMPSAALATGKAGALRHATSLARSYAPRADRPSLSAAAIPAEYLGTTFVWDVDTDTYITSDLGGAPSNGVRFILYAINPANLQPIEPLVEVGYVDLTATQTTSSATVHAIVVSGGVTYFDYAVVVSGSTSSANISIAGYATNGTDRVNFDLETTLSGNEQDGFQLTFDYQLTVPTRGGFLMDIEVTTGFMVEDPTITLDLLARGTHGTVRIQGSETTTGGSYNVTVNGDPFATITVNSTTATIVGADGQPLSQEELDALEGVWGMFAEGFDFFEDLFDPVL